MKEIKDIWGWLNEITLYKTPSKKISEESWESFNSYMINRFVSMNIHYCEVANLGQTIPYDNKKQLYEFYRELIPKKKTFLKYIKSKKKSPNSDLLNILAKYFTCSLREAEDYIKILHKNDLKDILLSQGKDEKEIKKLLK